MNKNPLFYSKMKEKKILVLEKRESRKSVLDGLTTSLSWYHINFKMLLENLSYICHILPLDDVIMWWGIVWEHMHHLYAIT